MMSRPADFGGRRAKIGRFATGLRRRAQCRPPSGGAGWLSSVNVPIPAGHDEDLIRMSQPGANRGRARVLRVALWLTCAACGMARAQQGSAPLLPPLAGSGLAVDLNSL